MNDIFYIFTQLKKMTIDVRRNFINASLATIVAELATLPICTAKSRYQNTTGISFRHLMKKILKEEGISAFYRASVPAILSQTFSTGSKWTLYRKFNESLEWNENKIVNSVINSVAGGVITSIITHPFDVVRVHFQMQQKTDLKGWNFRQFYRGYSKSLGKTVLGGLTYFPIYEQIKPLFSNSLLAGASTAIIATTISQPFDYLKTRQVYQGKNLYQNFQWKSLYKGYTLNLARVVPHYAITMYCIDKFEKF